MPALKDKFRTADENYIRRRQQVMWALAQATTPVSPGDLHRFLTGVGCLSHGTIVRTIRALVTAGLAKEVAAPPPRKCPHCGSTSITSGPTQWRCKNCLANGRLDRRYAAVNATCAHTHLQCRDCSATLSR